MARGWCRPKGHSWQPPHPAGNRYCVLAGLPLCVVVGDRAGNLVPGVGNAPAGRFRDLVVPGRIDRSTLQVIDFTYHFQKSSLFEIKSLGWDKNVFLTLATILPPCLRQFWGKLFFWVSANAHRSLAFGRSLTHLSFCKINFDNLIQFFYPEIRTGWRNR